MNLPAPGADCHSNSQLYNPGTTEHCRGSATTLCKIGLEALIKNILPYFEQNMQLLNINNTPIAL